MKIINHFESVGLVGALRVIVGVDLKVESCGRREGGGAHHVDTRIHCSLSQENKIREQESDRMEGKATASNLAEVNLNDSPVEETRTDVVFTTPPRWDPIMRAIFLIFPCIIITSFLVYRVRLHHRIRESDFRHLVLIHFAVVFLAILFSLGISIPRQLSVRSDRTVLVQTLLLTRSFTGVISANPSNHYICFMTRLHRFSSTALYGCVSVHREHGWILQVSPEDEEGFLRAIETVTNSGSADESTV